MFPTRALTLTSPEYHEIKTQLVACLSPDSLFSFKKQSAFILKGGYILSKQAQEVCPLA